MTESEHHGPVEEGEGRACWQIVVAILAVIALVVVGLLLATGDHGPSRHEGAAASTTALGPQ